MRLILSVTIILALFFSPVSAQDFQKGLKAFQAGNYAAAIKEWKPLAEKGVSGAQINIGVMYEKGNGFPQNYPEAIKWYRLAAEKGKAVAQNNIGYMYENGKGVLQDYSEAIKWYRLAAEQGDAYAQGSLGILHYQGNGVLQDNLTAHMWLNISSANGNKDSGLIRAAIADEMTPEDISKATAMAKECMGSDYNKC